ncbi:MAG: hypothetical protein SPH68_07215 [Candidatus Borkfalkiaceae bacterium]|nr:hypothetical protein [Clostridia bacterium]MDY6223929.1 hypothetical protein [Christensenellaceae bacterium]
MDARITKKRLGQMLSYDWIKIIACVVAGIVLWSLIFTTTATRLNPAQTFTVYAYMGTAPADKFSAKISSRTALAEKFSYDVIETSVVDLTAAGDQAYTLLEARSGVQEGNAAFVSPMEISGAKYKNDQGEEYTPTYLQDIITRLYSGVLTPEKAEGNPKSSFFDRTEAFLGIYYSDISNADTLNVKKVEEAFRTRIKAQKDKRYKNEAQIAQGIADETARIRGYRENYLAVKGYLSEGIIALQKTDIYLSSSESTVKYTGYYSINLCPDERMSALKELICYKTADGNYTAENMQLVLLDLLGEEYGYGLYENYALICKLVETYRAA